MTVLRSKGYDGASLNELANSSGLKKASLYHRYPGGKKEIALAVLQFVDKWVDTHIVNVLIDSSMQPKERLQLVTTHIDAIYGAGTKACLLRALSTESGVALFGAELQNSMNKWIAGFTRFGLELGQVNSLAESNAYTVLALIQGSLVISTTFGDNKAFNHALAEINRMYSS